MNHLFSRARAALAAAAFVAASSVTFVAPAAAQGTTFAYVVTSCGTLPAAYTGSTVDKPQFGAIVVDINGNLCSGVTQGTSPWIVSSDPCQSALKVTSPISVVSPNAQAIIVAGSGTTKIYICSLVLTESAAGAVSLTEGTGANCSGSTAAVAGSATVPAQGMALATNGVLTLGSANGTVASTKTGGNALCLYGFTGTVAGVLSLVQQ